MVVFQDLVDRGLDGDRHWRLDYLSLLMTEATTYVATGHTVHRVVPPSTFAYKKLAVDLLDDFVK